MPPPTRSAVQLPPADDWRTTDQDEINRRRLRAREEAPDVVNRDGRYPFIRISMSTRAAG